MKQRKMGTFAFAIAIAGSMLMAAPAQAASQGLSNPQPPTETCWLDATTDVTQCFKNDKEFRDAVVAQTGTEVVYPDSSTSTAKTEASTQMTTASTYVLAIMYTGASYGGSQWVVTTPYSTLCGAHSYTTNSMSATWNDQIGSFKTYGTCKVRLAEHTYQRGLLYGPYTSQTSLGTMNDKASSFWITG